MKLPGKILLQNLEVLCLIGVSDAERRTPRRLVLEVEADSDFAAAAADRLEAESADYAELGALLRTEAGQSRFRLLENLAEHLARVVLERFPVRRIRLRVLKPQALPGCAAAGVEVVREAGPAPGKAPAAPA